MRNRSRKATFRAAVLAAALAAGHASAIAQDKAAAPGGGEDEAALEQGRAIFTTEAAPQCGICHILADAGTTGTIGPNLDDLKPTADRVKLAVEGGVGVMPAYGEALTEEQIEAVAQYVATVAGGE
jgi:mono/diheme cytochrome c family protein